MAGPSSFPSFIALTCLIGSDVDRGKLRDEGALARDAVDRLDLEGVLRVGQQVADVDVPLGQAELPRDELHVFVATHALPTLHAALLADDVIQQVTSAT